MLLFIKMQSLLSLSLQIKKRNLCFWYVHQGILRFAYANVRLLLTNTFK